MRNPGHETTQLFENLKEYREHFVAFVDVMGVKNYIHDSKGPNDLKWFSQLMHVYASQPFAENKVYVTMFSDCMYLVAEEQYLNELIGLLANFAFKLLVNRETYVTVGSNGLPEETIIWNCFKLRGGITYGKVVALDEEAKQKKIPHSFNMVLGPAALAAYELENSKAVYPRIIVDKAFLEHCKDRQISLDDFYLMQDNEEDYLYLDFWSYMFKGKVGQPGFLNGCIDFVRGELAEAKAKRNARLTDQLCWYLEYLEKHLK